MQRFKFDFPNKVLFETSFRIAQEDINYAGHLGNERLLVFATEAKKRFFVAKGFQDVYTRGGEGTIVASNLIIYSSEAFLDETLLVELAVSELNEVSFDLNFRFTAKEDGRLIGYVQSGTVYYDYENGRIKEISGDLWKILDQDDG